MIRSRCQLGCYGSSAPQTDRQIAGDVEAARCILQHHRALALASGISVIADDQRGQEVHKWLKDAPTLHVGCNIRRYAALDVPSTAPGPKTLSESLSLPASIRLEGVAEVIGLLTLAIRNK